MTFHYQPWIEVLNRILSLERYILSHPIKVFLLRFTLSVRVVERLKTILGLDQMYPEEKAVLLGEQLFYKREKIIKL